MIKKLPIILSIITTLLALLACNKSDKASNLADSMIKVNIYKLVESGDTYNENNLIGTIMFSDSKDGLLIEPNLQNLAPGYHGFHIHTNPSCEPKMKDGKQVLGLAAGGHFDPENTGQHKGPYSSEGHLGDLPVLYVNDIGFANTSMIASRLKLKDIDKHSVMIHSGADNYSDKPEALGGGGSRMSCGVIDFSAPGAVYSKFAYQSSICANSDTVTTVCVKGS